MSNCAGQQHFAVAGTVPSIPPPVPQPRSSALGLLAALTFLVATGLLVLYFFNPARHGFYPFCVFYKTTGLLCPGCGSLRAIHQLLHGNLVEALRLNAFFVLALPFAGWVGFRLIREAAGWPAAPLNISTRWVWFAFVLLLLFTVGRNLL